MSLRNALISRPLGAATFSCPVERAPLRRLGPARQAARRAANVADCEPCRPATGGDPLECRCTRPAKARGPRRGIRAASARDPCRADPATPPYGSLLGPVAPCCKLRAGRRMAWRRSRRPSPRRLRMRSRFLWGIALLLLAVAALIAAPLPATHVASPTGWAPQVLAEEGGSKTATKGEAKGEAKGG